MIVRTRVLHERKVNDVFVRLEDDPDKPTNYRVTIMQSFDDYINAMDNLRRIEQEAKKGYVSITDN